MLGGEESYEAQLCSANGGHLIKQTVSVLALDFVHFIRVSAPQISVSLISALKSPLMKNTFVIQR